MLEVGDKVEDFELPNQHGELVTLTDLLKSKYLVLFFYPKDFTGGCTKEVCAFREYIDDYDALGVRVVGVSRDSVNSHLRFAQRHNLPFDLLSDKKGELRKQFKVPRELGIIDGRVTFVVDQNRVICHSVRTMTKPLKHVLETLDHFLK